jgi:hypothetical protein
MQRSEQSSGFCFPPPPYIYIDTGMSKISSTLAYFILEESVANNYSDEFLASKITSHQLIR